ncbi:mandelate racemase/muconate lactonizing enzyme family protein [Aurantiacibacter gangjinensis]|uniref:mandelate racemase/muconate lactonizing enzyme family protein n=1 Tax=Aurantiacibacter gangjinensis TaxID=502682 RepID=UPI00069BF5EE|nr:mandelate racemase/muconate lactonizing enzyme family protein [Aurantiacibacter gangjinensis]APE26878.1 mandelate racemase/muconate lactonizing enzyme family protein [Aurantiacibacter gangjinensis]
MRNSSKACNRRGALKAAAAGLGAGMGLVAAPAFAQLAGHVGQITIASVEAFAVRRAIFVKVTASDGTAGWGEAGHSGGRLVADVVRREIAPLYEGEDVFNGYGLWAKGYYEVDELGPGGLASQALAGVDCALWDLRGKLLGVPVWALLGGKVRDSFPVYGSFSRSLGEDRLMTPDDAARRAVELMEEGFRAIKVRMAIREEGVDPADDPTMPTARAVRQAIGDDVPLYVDANNGYRAARAIIVGRALYEELGVEVFEEPCAMHHYASTREVSDACDIMVANGEHEYTPFAFRDLIDQAKPDLLNPDVSKLSGLTPGIMVASMAYVRDLPISVHNARPTLLSAAHTHYVAWAETANRTQEHPGRVRLASLWDYFEETMLPVDGIMQVPDTPGLGLTPIEERIRADAN